MAAKTRWNGWGDETVALPIKPEAQAFLAAAVGASERPKDVSLERALADVAAQPSRLPPHPLVSTDQEARLRASFGQSAEDWLRLRFGAIGRVVDAVAFPESEEEARAALAFAAQNGACALPVGGATSVVGHLRPIDDRPVLAISMRRMNRLRALDRESRLATFEAGASGPEVEAQLRAEGFTLGHFPQSFDYSTLGGWIVTRSSGQQSLRYGRIERMFAGGRMLTPRGDLDLPTFPASAAGPDLREWALGSEGRIGLLTEAKMRVQPAPEKEKFVGVFFRDWERARGAARALVQARVDLSLARVSNARETTTNLRLAGGAAVRWLERYLAARGLGEGKCLLLVGLTGDALAVQRVGREATAIWRGFGGVSTGTRIGAAWAKRRFSGVYLRNSLWEAGYMVETMETACDWPRVAAMVEAIERAGEAALAATGERALAFTHLSHLYPQGSSVYATFVFRIGGDFETAFKRWRGLKDAVGDAIAANGGTITHQHGIGKDHAPWLAREKGALGMVALAATIRAFDPDGAMARGNLLGDC